MKKILKICVSIVAFLFGLNIVNAAECEDLYMYADDSFWTRMNIYMNYNSQGTRYALYTLKDNSSVTYSAYCRNPNKKAGRNGVTKYKCTDTIFDATSEDKKTKTYGAGIVDILKNGYSTRNPKYNGVSDEKEYAATNLALRTYEMLWKDHNTNDYKDLFNYAHQYYANLWLDDEKISEWLKDMQGSVREKFANAIQVTSWTDENGTNITDDIVERAKTLVKSGVQAAYNYHEKGAAALKGVDKEPLKSTSPVIENNGKKTYKQTLTYTFEAEKFKSDGAYIKINFECKNCSQYGVAADVIYNGSVDPDGEILINKNNLDKDGNATIKLEIEFSGNSDRYNCENLDYVIDLEWFDETISVEAYDMYSEKCSSSSECQHFYMLYAVDTPTKKEIPDSTELCSITCKDLEATCAANNYDMNNPSCQKFYNDYNGNCAQCTTKIDNPKCEKGSDNRYNILEGYEVDPENCGSSKENIKQCVIENEDPAGNEYKADNIMNDANQLKDNKYCTVYCKEDYYFQMPGIQAANSGRYFSLSTTVTGTKTCYTSEIDKDNTFESDLEEARKEVIRAWNDWSKWNTASEIINANANAIQSSPVYFKEDCGSGSYTNYYLSWEYVYINEYNKEVKKTDTIQVNGNSNCDCTSKGSCSPTDGSLTNLKKDISNSLNHVKGELDKAIEKYTNILNDYNSCSGINAVLYTSELEPNNKDGWKMDYNYNPTIKFWYEESYYNSVLKKELETQGTPKFEELYQEVCSQDVENDYKCKNPNSNNTRNDSPFVCRKNGDTYICDDDKDIVISTAKYVKQSITVNASYTTPTQFYTIYPYGGIVASENGKIIENSTALVNSLPVGLGTSQGVYNYALKVENLGEYYNKNELGRIWGNSNSVVVNVLNDSSNTCVNEGALIPSANTSLDPDLKDGVYVCAYKVNCPDCPVVCDPTCKWDGCPDNSCPVVCENCIFTNNSTNVGYKPISPGDVNPSDREMGVNWQWDEPIETALELKAYATTTEIEENGETIYDVNYEDVSTDTDFAMQVKLDTKMINLIKSYNDQYENDGGYANNTLKCYDYKGSDGITYDNIYCYSTFLDEMIEKTGGPKDNGGSDNIKIVGGERLSSDIEREANTQLSGYWTTWSIENNNGWTINTEQGIAYYMEKYKEIGIGPSWK